MTESGDQALVGLNSHAMSGGARQNSPCSDTVSRVQSAFSSRQFSSNARRLRRSASDLSECVEVIPRCCPNVPVHRGVLPREKPANMRPPVKWSSMARFSANWIGLTAVRFMPSWPTRMRSVCWAMK